MDFAGLLLSWYKRHKRDLPWRSTKDPYRIWLSEVILQQTRVQQGLPYYEKFVAKYPTVRHLAEAPIDEVLKLWQGLGYYSRARNLHAAAKLVVAEHGGQFPSTYKELLALKGVGEYTAAAIASFCFKEPQAVVDGNVYRVLSRIFGIGTPIDSTAGKKEFRELAATLLDPKNPADYNQAVMEFGAIQCVPKSPDCMRCVFVQHCEARKNELIETLPVKAKKTKITDRFFYYLVIHHKGHIYLRRRTGKDIWSHLFDFPLIETKKKLSQKQLLQTGEWKKLFAGKEITLTDFSEEYRHVLSHQKLHVHFIEMNAKEKLPAEIAKEWLYIKERTLKDYAVPVLIGNYLQERKG